MGGNVKLYTEAAATAAIEALKSTSGALHVNVRGGDATTPLPVQPYGIGKEDGLLHTFTMREGISLLTVNEAQDSDIKGSVTGPAVGTQQTFPLGATTRRLYRLDVDTITAIGGLFVLAMNGQAPATGVDSCVAGGVLGAFGTIRLTWGDVGGFGDVFPTGISIVVSSTAPLFTAVLTPRASIRYWCGTDT